ncbi:LOW QUALITY PROTEIN: sister chromatid cohesion 1 protein 1 [Phoenix dactylifera]|uniref:LOW QUALITY PROTEIN: sister chromatid cohesion 1 protein 1 n=1 Tax=Phoenix dactylifera TaxID=42345 RepID=A0A8B9A375_PHODC|nr:LOW QUALITY PROTEIN: sister chromatid cohesion 1 protein 1 [Phoenix dactylifera]
MFYSHQLLARKAPLGQIWMAATMHAKINRRKLDQLDIIKICEEILNPSVPMALRLSGILMGGVVIVYERKVKLLYDDVTRFLVILKAPESNEAWKVKAVSDSTVLPKGKPRPSTIFEAVTLPDNVDMEVEQPMHFRDASFPAARFQHMIDDLDEFYVNIDIRDEDDASHHHQGSLPNITLFDDLWSDVAETDLYNRFERFDIGGDDDTQTNSQPQEQPQVPGTLVPSPPPRDEQPRAPEGGIMDPQMEEREEQRRQQPPKRKARRNLTQVIMDNEQLMIPGSIYQTWLHNSFQHCIKKRKKIKSFNPILSTKISNLMMDLPPVALISGLEKFPAEIYYPAPLLELWRKCTQPKLDSTSSPGGTPPQAQQPQRQSSPPGFYPQDVPQFPQEEFQRVIGSDPLDISIEKLRANLENMDFQGVDDAASSDHFVHSRKPWAKRRQHSSSRTTLGSLDPVEEELPLQQEVRDSKLRRLSGNGPTPDFELLEETGPTQTPHPVSSGPSGDKITQSIRTQLKLHFDTPGAAQSESLDQLAFGMNRKRAAQLFYQTCVLATCDFIKVQQVAPYGDILISKGPKM